MNFIRACQVRATLGALLLTTAWLPAYAEATAVASHPDASLQQLKFDAVTIDAELHSAEANLRFPLARRVIVDASVNAPDLQLQELTVRVDNGEPVHQIYTHAEAIAFRSGGLQRVLSLSAAPGTHRLHVEFSAMLNSGSPREPTVTGSFDQSFEKPADLPITLELALVRDDARSAPALRRRSWDYEPGTANDPRIRESIYLVAAHHFLEAAAVDAAVVAEPTSSPNAQLALVDALLDFGSRERAEALLAQVVTAGGGPRSLFDTQMQLATLDYRNGDVEAASSRLLAVRDKLSPEQQARWDDLKIRLLLAGGQYKNAIPLLRSAEERRPSPYLHYNLGIALLNAGETAKGRTILDAIGTIDAATEELLSLRDQANVVLGYDYLRRKKGGEAWPVFERVRLDGPYASRALLGLGWARFEEHGHMPRQRWGSDTRGKTPDDVRTDAAIALPDFSGERAADLKKALIPWAQLKQRDPLDPAVQEALLAIPYALQKAGADQQAEDGYRNALDVLQKTRESLDQAAVDLSRTPLFDELVGTSPLSDDGWAWQPQALPATRTNWLLRPLIAEDQFQTALRDYRDARFLAAESERWQVRLRALRQLPPCRSTGIGGGCATGVSDTASQLDVLNQRIATLKTKADAAAGTAYARLQALATAELQAQKKTTESYMLQARMALSRLYDAPPEDAQ